MPLTMLGRNDQIAERLAQRLGARPSEQALCLRIPFDDATRLVDLHKCVQCCINDPAREHLALLQLGLDLAPLRRPGGELLCRSLGMDPVARDGANGGPCQ